MKIFDTFTVNTAALLITLCSVFETCSIIKPTTSRPSNSEKNKKRKYNIYEIGSYFYTLGVFKIVTKIQLPIKIQPDFPIFVSTFSRAAKIFTIVYIEDLSFKEWFKKKATKFDPTNILLLSLACLQCLNLNNFDLEESWSDFREVVIKLPPLTLLKITCNSDKFVVLDAYYIYNEAIWNFPLQERKKSIKILCQTMSDSSDKTITHTLAENSNVLHEIIANINPFT
ncbi:LOW QUALITY PROTEIN: hypothetical protein HZS_2851 [Henneguya salminicola]|nr:LOW QUALITY PROTEIN: hypothetical protein HZS_2851 [Henneguya salminicola]